MIHNVILSLCIAAALAALAVAVWTLVGSKIDSDWRLFSGHALSHSFNQFVGSRRNSADVVMRTPGARSLPGGWLLIHRAMRARRDIRLRTR